MKADWCEDLGGVIICGTDMEEHSRRSELQVVLPLPEASRVLLGWTREWGDY